MNGRYPRKNKFRIIWLVNKLFYEFIGAKSLNLASFFIKFF